MKRALIFLFAALASGQTPSSPPSPPQPKAPALPKVYESIVITASPVEPAVEQRNREAFDKTLFSRDDQVFHLLEAGINAGQHEGGGKSIEVRRYGFNLDHGGVSGGLKVLIDNIQQNQSTQGHGQGYLGALKSMSPELVDEVDVYNGPFRSEYGDFSGLGVVHIRTREALPEQYTVRVQGGSFASRRGFLGWSPDWRETDMLVAYDGSLTDGPFIKPLDYRRDNLTFNLTRRLNDRRSVSVKFNGGRNNFNSSGQAPLDEVAAGRLDPFGYLDPGDGGRVKQGTLAGYFRQETAGGTLWKFDGFLTRSLFDMYSNFTFFLNDPELGDGIQQHDSRLMQGANAQMVKPHRQGATSGLFTAGGNLHLTQTLVGLYSRVNRTPYRTDTLANAGISNGAGFVQEDLSLYSGRLRLGGGARYDVFRFDVRDRMEPEFSGAHTSGEWQPKAHVSLTPSYRIPLTLHANYGRGISSLDARGVVRSEGGRRLATTDFVQAGTSHNWRRVSLILNLFLINRSNELVYIPDDGSLEFLGPTRAYGWEAKSNFRLTRRLAVHGGFTRVINAYYRNTLPREYVDRAPHFTANAGLTLSAWKGWSGSVRMRAISSYRLDPLDAANRAAGHTVFDLSLTRRLMRGVDFLFAVDNFTDRSYYETQNYFESRLRGAGPVSRIHATPGYPVTFTAGLSFRFRGK
ncbi:MAG: TonB-dependent receptor [Bryobacterales bacterium]|nr:TonB-dependent receptor [Bryobacterales bacterium]